MTFFNLAMSFILNLAFVAIVFLLWGLIKKKRLFGGCDIYWGAATSAIAMLVLCGANCRMKTHPEIKRLIYFLPDSPPVGTGENVSAVYLSPYDRYGWNQMWKAKYHGKTRLFVEFR